MYVEEEEAHTVFFNWFVVETFFLIYLYIYNNY